MLRHGSIDGGKLLYSEGAAECAERFGQTIAAPGTDERNNVRPLLGDPGDGNLRDVQVGGLGQTGLRYGGLVGFAGCALGLVVGFPSLIRALEERSSQPVAAAIEG
jgi:hypothetical protein